MSKVLVRTNSDAANKAAASNGRVHNRNVVSEFLLEHTVKVLTSSNGHQRVRICQIREDSNLVTVFKLSSGCHFV